MRDRIVITGNQLLCALGEDPREVAQKLIAKASGLSEYSFVEMESPPQAWFGAVMLDLKKALGGKGWRHHNRASLMSCLLARRLLVTTEYSACFEHDPVQLGFVLGYNHNVFSPELIETLEARSLVHLNPGFFLTMSTNSVASQVAILVKIQGLTLTHTTGWLAGLEAVHTATHFLRANRVQRVLAGGVEEGMVENIYSMATAFQGPSQAGVGIIQIGEPNAIPAGEGCALLHLEKERTAIQNHRKPRAYVSGFGMGVQIKEARAGDATAAVQAITTALQQAGLTADAIDAVFLSANGNAAQDQAEARALQQVFQKQVPPTVAIKGALGDTFHAGGAIAVSVAIACAELKTIPPTLHLSDAKVAGKINLSAEARSWPAHYVLILSLEQDQKAGALILEFPPEEGRA